MSNIIFFANSIKTAGQFPLDGKTLCKKISDLKSNIDINAFRYYEGLTVLCIENKKQYIWIEREDLNRIGVLDTDFVYPSNSISNGIDYSGRSFNFFELVISSDNGGGNNELNLDDVTSFGNTTENDIIVEKITIIPDEFGEGSQEDTEKAILSKQSIVLSKSSVINGRPINDINSGELKISIENGLETESYGIGNVFNCKLKEDLQFSFNNSLKTRVSIDGFESRASNIKSSFLNSNQLKFTNGLGGGARILNPEGNEIIYDFEFPAKSGTFALEEDNQKFLYWDLQQEEGFASTSFGDDQGFINIEKEITTGKGGAEIITTNMLISATEKVSVLARQGLEVEGYVTVYGEEAPAQINLLNKSTGDSLDISFGGYTTPDDVTGNIGVDFQRKPGVVALLSDIPEEVVEENINLSFSAQGSTFSADSIIATKHKIGERVFLDIYINNCSSDGNATDGKINISGFGDIPKYFASGTIIDRNSQTALENGLIASTNSPTLTLKDTILNNQNLILSINFLGGGNNV